MRKIEIIRATVICCSICIDRLKARVNVRSGAVFWARQQHNLGAKMLEDTLTAADQTREFGKLSMVD